MGKGKWYVVWVGKVAGVYAQWEAASVQIKEFPGARYKSFPSREEAEYAFSRPWQEFVHVPPKGVAGRAPALVTRVSERKKIEHRMAESIRGSISVDAACSGNPGKMEYRGVRTDTHEEIFHSPVFPEGTNNIGEFLALVHALALYSEKFPDLPIYSDSVNAMNWVKKGKCKTKLEHNPRTAALHQMIERAEKWLETHSFKNPILKWQTDRWGEIPADFGRK